MENLINRRQYLFLSSLTLSGLMLPFSKQSIAEIKRNKDRCMGAWFGAAIADALGGPIEIQHAARIRKYYGWVDDFIPYSKPPGLLDLKPGYALQPDAGSITDDSMIRIDVAKFLIENPYPWSADQMSKWMLHYADLENWWQQAVNVLRRIEKGEFPAEEGGLHHIQGGGGAWWTPYGILFAGNVDKAVKEVRKVARIWKAPLELDILSGVVAGTAESLRNGATWESVADAIIEHSGIGKEYFVRAAELARQVKSSDELIGQLYLHCLYRYKKDQDGTYQPEKAKYEVYKENVYTSIAFVEQQPLALAAFVFGKGEPVPSILQAINGGRDADSIASNVGGWCGGLHGENGLPKKWVDRVVEVNHGYENLRRLGEKLLTIDV